MTEVKKIKVKFDEIEYEVSSSQTILEAAREVGVDIPSLCASNERCGICAVQLKGAEDTILSCNTYITDNMEVLVNNSELAINQRKAKMAEIVKVHEFKCANCFKKGNCEILKISGGMRIRKDPSLLQTEKNILLKQTINQMTIDTSKCILCGRCATACANKAGIGAICWEGDKLVYDESKCTYCGQCIKACPCDAVHEKTSYNLVKEALANPDIHVSCAIAPSVRVSLGDEFGVDYGVNIQGKIYTALRNLGFDSVFDLNFTADVTIVEEGEELLHQMKEGGKFPVFTSCCPGWVEHARKIDTKFLAQLSTTKSPQQIYGALAKSYFAKNSSLNPKQIFTVSIVPCTAKKAEAALEKNSVNGLVDIDAALTTRELARLIKEKRIPIATLEDSTADKLLGEFSGGGAIFGASGGVMESALRYAYEKVEGKPLPRLEFTELRTHDYIKTAEVQLQGKTHKVAVVNGTIALKKFYEEYLPKEDYLFVEVMACSGGCISGGGQPYLTSATIAVSNKIKEKRVEGLHKQDKEIAIHNPAHNPMIKKLYDEYLKKPGSELAESLLHTEHEKFNHSKYKVGN